VRTGILAEAFGADQEFFAFIRSMEAYRTSMHGENTTLMVEPDSDFFNYLRSPNLAAEPRRRAPATGNCRRRPPGRGWMVSDLLLGLGLVAIVEGLVLALAPTRLRDVLRLIEAIPPEQLRTIGLLAVTLGVGLVWLARGDCPAVAGCNGHVTAQRRDLPDRVPGESDGAISRTGPRARAAGDTGGTNLKLSQNTSGPAREITAPSGRPAGGDVGAAGARHRPGPRARAGAAGPGAGADGTPCR
jgi:uncharacterized protein